MEASPRITGVMARLRRACGGRVCGSYPLPRGRCERDAQSFGETCEIVRPPTVAQGDRDGDRLRVAADGQLAGAADELGEERFGVELVEQQLQEPPRPAQGRGAFGEEPKETWADRAAPAFEVSDVLLPERLEASSFRVERETR